MMMRKPRESWEHQHIAGIRNKVFTSQTFVAKMLITRLKSPWQTNYGFNSWFRLLELFMLEICYGKKNIFYCVFSISIYTYVRTFVKKKIQSSLMNKCEFWSILCIAKFWMVVRNMSDALCEKKTENNFWSCKADIGR